MKTVREVRAVGGLSACNRLREVSAGGAREVREVIVQIFENIAGGEGKSAGGCALYTPYIPRHRLLARRAWDWNEGALAGGRP
jgi:hypothetical protein